MVTQLIIVWVLGLVTFFVLWVILLKIIHRISEKKGQKIDATTQEAKDTTPTETKPS